MPEIELSEETIEYEDTGLNQLWKTFSKHLPLTGGCPAKNLRTPSRSTTPRLPQGTS